MFEHPIVHIALPAKDSLEYTKFYGDVFRWKLEHSKWQK